MADLKRAEDEGERIRSVFAWQSNNTLRIIATSNLPLFQGLTLTRQATATSDWLGRNMKQPHPDEDRECFLKYLALFC